MCDYFFKTFLNRSRLRLELERFSIKCRKTKTKVITIALYDTCRLFLLLLWRKKQIYSLHFKILN